MNLWSDNMGNILNKIVNNNALFVGVIILLCIILIALIILIIRSARESKKINIYEEELEDEDIKKVKNVKKEDIIETPDTNEDTKEEIIREDTEKEEEISKEETEEEIEKEIEQRYDEEKEKEIEEIREDNPNSEIEQLLSKMEADSKLKPEDIVANFEEEQEAQSIISYKELVDAVKNRQEDVYEDELESKPLATVSDFMKQKEAQELENSAILSIKDISENFEVDEIKSQEDSEEKENTVSKFKKTDVISPVFGIVGEQHDSKKKGTIDETIDLTDVNLTDIDFRTNNETKEELREEDAAITALDEIYKHMAEDLIKNNEELGETASLEELTRNEEFLQSLKDFRKKL